MRQTEQIVSPMSNEGRNAYVVEHLKNAFLELFSEKPLNDISVSELAERAGVGRASFYRNYECKEDILKEHIDDLFREWTNEGQRNEGAPLSEQIRIMIAHFEKRREFYKLLSDRGYTYLLKNALIRVYGPKPEDEAVQAYSSAFVAYTLYGWIEVWLQRGMRESADEMAEMFRAQGL
ncbi:MAG: TetR/AcrR family transcriptional regulator [Roseburia sp.]|nr:TetR/AcrR family transcriptional regulator [Roseburia sp.]MCM1098916.1 TetR/AcrR family transcriptional regulator [Ruminococcus flavefaciens]